MWSVWNGGKLKETNNQRQTNKPKTPTYSQQLEGHTNNKTPLNITLLIFFFYKCLSNIYFLTSTTTELNLKHKAILTSSGLIWAKKNSSSYSKWGTIHFIFIPNVYLCICGSNPLMQLLFKSGKNENTGTGGLYLGSLGRCRLKALWIQQSCELFKNILNNRIL